MLSFVLVAMRRAAWAKKRMKLTAVKGTGKRDDSYVLQ